MTTRQELIEGLRAVTRTAERVTSRFAPDDWNLQAHGEEEGWNRKQVFAHLAAAAEITPAFVGALANQSPGKSVTDGLDINAFNAQQVGAKAQLSPSDLMAAFQKAYDGVIKFVQEAPEETLTQLGRFGTLEAPVIDIMDTVLVMHAMAHIYHGGGSPV